MTISRTRSAFPSSISQTQRVVSSVLGFSVPHSLAEGELIFHLKTDVVAAAVTVAGTDTEMWWR